MRLIGSSKHSAKYVQVNQPSGSKLTRQVKHGEAFDENSLNDAFYSIKQKSKSGFSLC